MTKRTRLFVAIAAGILVVGLGTGLLASYMGVQNLTLIGGNGPEEFAYVPSDTQVLAFANVRSVMDSELRRKLMELHPGAANADQFQERTGINIETDVDSVVAAIGSGPRDGAAAGAGSRSVRSGPPRGLCPRRRRSRRGVQGQASDHAR